MLDRLLESRGKQRKSVGGAVFSVCAHTILIVAAVYATAQARSVASAGTTPRPIYYSLPRQPLSQENHRTAPRTNTVRSAQPSILRYIDVPTIDVRVPSIEMSGATTTANDLGARDATADTPGPPSTLVREIGAPFRAEQVEKQVALKDGNAPPRYPAVLQSSGIEGRVLALFVVDENGRVQDSTVKFVSFSNPLFQDAVRVALQRMRFIPAEIGGKAVRQLVQMPFVFTLQK